jgi:hypothetical protein
MHGIHGIKKKRLYKYKMYGNKLKNVIWILYEVFKCNMKSIIQLDSKIMSHFLTLIGRVTALLP